MNLYRKLVPEIIRTQIRNPQYIFDDLKFLIRLLQSKINTTSTSKIIPKSVCYLVSTTNITGGTYVICEHINRLQKIGFKCLIVTLENKTNLSWFPNQSVKIIPLKGNNKIVEKYETVIATSWITAYELLLLKVKQKMYLIQANEIPFYPKFSYLKTRVKRTYTFPFKFISISRWLQKFLKENFNKGSFYVPNGINTDIFHPSIPLEPKLKNKKRVLLEGAIDIPFKGMEEAFKVVQDLDCEVWCVSYNGRPKPEWHCNRFFEKVPIQNMARVYSSCDILLKLSTMEGFGYPPLEMMACGGVSVVSNIKGHQEYIVDKHNALFVNPNDIKKAKLLVNKLIKNETLYKKLQFNGQKTVQKYKWENSINKLKEIYSSSDQ